MAEEERKQFKRLSDLDPIENEWGAPPDDNFGYTSEEERRAHRGLEDWELLDKMSDSQPGLFDWLHTVVGAVIVGVVIFALVAYGIYYIAYHYGPHLLGKS